ncbi:MAG: DNA repair protein RecO [Legionellaceae bacterium]
MNNRVILQPAYILHSRPYRDTSAIIDVFSRDYGYISGIAQGVRSNRSKIKGILQAFNPLLLSWSGKRELMYINGVELNGSYYSLTGLNLISAMYLNELLLRVLHKFIPYPQLYDFYDTALSQLVLADNVRPILRIFEKKLLQELGYGLILDSCAKTGKPVDAQKKYYFQPSLGVFEISATTLINNPQYVFSGTSLLAFMQEVFTQPEYLRDAKKINQFSLAMIIGDKPLKSRELLISGGQK